MRHTFGGGVADYVVRPSDGLWGVAPNTTLTFWSARDGGTQYTDLLDATGAAATSITTDEYGGLPVFSGPDDVVAMWVDADGARRVRIEAHATSAGGGGGGGYTSISRIVASATAPADVRTAATYVCDGVADQEEIQRALDDARDHGGGEIQLTVGTYNLTAPLSIEGTDVVDVEIGILLRGQGARATMLVAADGIESALHLTKVVRVQVESLGITIGGTTDGITSSTTNGPSSGHRSFWNSSFKNLQINGPWDGSHSGWALNLGSPFRSVFENIEIGGVGSGVRMYSEHADFNPGDLTFERCFVDLKGNNGTAYKIESTTPSGVMNQLEFEMCEAITDGTGATGIHIAGVGGWGTSHCHFRGVNLEQFDRLVHVEYGSSNTFRLNHVGLRAGASGLTAFVFGANSFNNTILSTGLLYVTDDCQLYSDANTLETSSPNRVLDSRVYRESSSLRVGGQLNPALTTVRKGIIGNTPLSSPKPASPGVYFPEGWGRYWLAARNKAAAGTGLARIVTVGGSATLGYFASNPRTKSWPGLVAGALQSSYGDGGSGFQGVSLSQTLAGDNAAAYAAWLTAGAAVAQSGTWTQGGSTFGPGATYIYSDQTGATLTFKARGTTVKIYTVTGSGTRPAMLYSIDGGADVSVPQPGGTAAIQTTTVTGLSNTEHTVVLKVGTATTGQYLSVCGVSGETASGVILHNCALGGATSSRYSNDTATSLNAVWNGGAAFPADLAVYSAAPNDAAAGGGGVAGDTWLANVMGWLRAVRASGTAADIIVALPHIGTHEGTNNRYQEYSRLIRPLADTYGFALVNWWVTGQNSWANWNAAGYWGTAATPGAAGTDGVHMSDAGFQHMADTVLPYLAA
ncbi:SGNH/GDSL hydrolase family protein [Streptomyces sp. EKS3.2]|uniref:SGNH/GDSL hydrolase family protein n=1 Tax=Streptomyces sp. EKS3.2 TaxID=3461008 RepID=UPI00404335C6